MRPKKSKVTINSPKAAHAHSNMAISPYTNPQQILLDGFEPKQCLGWTAMQVFRHVAVKSNLGR
jgi:hypothetical protein